MKTINIHGKEYLPVSERVKMAHADLKSLSITTEIINNDPIVFKATVTTPKGVFTGFSSANSAKMIEKTNPYEVAETSSVGRALGFAGYGLIDSIATADEIVASQAKVNPSPSSEGLITKKQTGFIMGLLEKKGYTVQQLNEKYEVTSLSQLTMTQASTIIENLTKLPDKEELDNDEIEKEIEEGK